MLLLIDNYDSFTFNLAQYFEELGQEVRVVRNDALGLRDIERMAPGRLVFSPGPGRPAEAGVTLEAIRFFAGRIPMLGVCLGYQAMAEAFGGRIVHAPALVHGKASRMIHDGRGMFRGLPNPLAVARYHSLVVDENSLPPGFEPCARTEDGLLMALRSREMLLEGVQFHPESILTPQGKPMLANWLEQAAAAREVQA